MSECKTNNLKNRVRKGQRVLMVLLVFVFVAGLVMTTFRKTNSDVEGISLACRNSDACLEAVAKEQEANRNAAVASDSANLYQTKVNELSAQIKNAEREIAATVERIDDLKQQIEETEKKLNDEQEALAEVLVNMHFENDAEPITILAGSVSISDLAEKQARNEVVKQQISATAMKVQKTKEKLESDKAEVEALLEEQKIAKVNLESAKAEQQEIVKKYQDDAAAYEAIAAEALEAQRAAEQAEKEAHPERYGGSSYTGYNTYPWQEDCPWNQDAYGTTINGVYVGGYVCECVSYVGWKAYEAYGLYLAWGNANYWDDNARAYDYRVDNIPEADSIGQIDDYLYGHVWWVESVNADGSVNVTEYNNAYATKLYSGDFHYGDFGSRTMSAEQAAQYNYIHLR